MRESKRFNVKRVRGPVEAKRGRVPVRPVLGSEALQR